MIHSLLAHSQRQLATTDSITDTDLCVACDGSELSGLEFSLYLFSMDFKQNQVLAKQCKPPGF